MEDQREEEGVTIMSLDSHPMIYTDVCTRQMLEQCRAKHVNESISIQLNSKFLISIIIEWSCWRGWSSRCTLLTSSEEFYFQLNQLLEENLCCLLWSNLCFLSILLRVIGDQV